MIKKILGFVFTLVFCGVVSAASITAVPSNTRSPVAVGQSKIFPWTPTQRVVEIGNAAILGDATGLGTFTSNQYLNVAQSAWIRKITGFSPSIQLSATTGEITFVTSDTGNEGTTANTVSALILRQNGTITTNRACASGFTRSGVDSCARTDIITTTAVPATCTIVTMPTAATRKVKLIVRLEVLGRSTVNVINSAEIAFYNDASCSTHVGSTYVQVFEFVATALSLGSTMIPVEFDSPANVLYSQAIVTTGSTARMQVRGYSE